MDLLGRKSRRQLDEYTVLAARLIRALQHEKTTLTEQLRQQEGEIVELKLKIESLTPKPIKNQPLYLNESEEDIEYAYRNELINKDQYEDMLRQLEFDNTNITFDLEAY